MLICNCTLAFPPSPSYSSFSVHHPQYLHRLRSVTVQECIKLSFYSPTIVLPITKILHAKRKIYSGKEVFFSVLCSFKTAACIISPSNSISLAISSLFTAVLATRLFDKYFLVFPPLAFDVKTHSRTSGSLPLSTEVAGSGCGMET